MQRSKSIDEKIAQWREHYLNLGGSSSKLQEFEDYLRQQMESLTASGLTADEAFLIEMKRVEELPSFSEKIGAPGAWKKFLLEYADKKEHRARAEDIFFPIILAVLAGFSTQLPRLFGIKFTENPVFYLKNVSFFFMPFIAIYFIRQREIPRPILLPIASTFLLSALLINLYPFSSKGQTLLLSTLHLPLFLWLITGIFYAGKEWRNVSRRMDFLRFTGEVFVYTTLLYCGIFVVSGLASVLFEAIGIHAEERVLEYFAIPVGVAAPVMAAYLVDRRKDMSGKLRPYASENFRTAASLRDADFLESYDIRPGRSFLGANFSHRH